MPSRIEMLAAVLAQNPKDTFARYGLAMEHSNAGDLEAALSEFNKLLEFDPDYSAAHFMAAQGLAKAGRIPEARKYLQDGIAAAVRKGNRHAQNEMSAMLDELNEG